MRNVQSKGIGAEQAPRTSKLARRATAAVLAGGMSLGLAGCGLDGTHTNLTNGANVTSCDDTWESPGSATENPAKATSAMQDAIAELVGDVSKSGAEKDVEGTGYRIDTLPQNLVGAAVGVLDHSANDRYVFRTSVLEQYDNEICVDDADGATYLTPAYMSAVGALANSGIQVQYGVNPAETTNQ
jgi:hypothetical protein